jgi:hypothetical protein
MFSNQLKNIYSYIKAPADKRPERLIWDQVYKSFFIEVGQNQYEFYRSPKEPRFMHIDLAESHDSAGISCVHPEVNSKGEIIIVTDFTIVVVPTKERINLESIEEFVYDLKRLGHLNLAFVTYDQYQSSQQRQNLEREEFETERFSVDNSVDPYYAYVSWLKNGRIKTGRNIFLKNNIKSLLEMKTEKGKKKIDHIKGRLIWDDGGDWNTSLMGINAKDLSDSHCGACFHLINKFKGIPHSQWIEDDDENPDDYKKIEEKVLNNIYKRSAFYIKDDEKEIKRIQRLYI